MPLPHLIFRRSAGYAETDAAAKLAEYNALFGLPLPNIPGSYYAGVLANLAAQADPLHADAAWAFCISDPGRRPEEPDVDVYPDSPAGRSYVAIPVDVVIDDIYRENAEWYVQGPIGP
jgi:hypothetical protein